MAIVNGKQVGLLEYSKSFLNREKIRDEYNNNNEYRLGHPNALSDGDDLGRGENNGQIGTKTDISQRKIAEAKNRYSANNQYDGSKV
jgi:hypothetical protein